MVEHTGDSVGKLEMFQHLHQRIQAAPEEEKAALWQHLNQLMMHVNCAISAGDEKEFFRYTGLARQHGYGNRHKHMFDTEEQRMALGKELWGYIESVRGVPVS